MYTKNALLLTQSPQHPHPAPLNSLPLLYLRHPHSSEKLLQSLSSMHLNPTQLTRSHTVPSHPPQSQHLLPLQHPSSSEKPPKSLSSSIHHLCRPLSVPFPTQLIPSYSAPSHPPKSSSLLPLPHPSSSEKSPQSLSPSHRHLWLIHRPELQRNDVVEQVRAKM